jgi:hypothetical protein
VVAVSQPEIQPIRARVWALRDRRTIVALALLVAASLRLPTLFQPLLEAHSFRQTQTAYTALLYHRNGIDLLHTPLPVLGPPWEVPFEFPLFQAGGAVLMDLGLGLEPALRGLSLACFLATGAVLWGLIERERGSRAAFAGLLFFLFSPFSLLWSRAATIEYLATLLGVAFVAMAMSWSRTGRGRTLAGAIALGAFAMLVKITTGLIWIGPALLLLRGALKFRVALVVIPLLAGVLWTAWADAIKATGPITRLLTSSALANWNFGPIEQRTDPATWQSFGSWTVPLGIGGLLALLFIKPRWARPGLRAWFVLVLIGGPVLFTNLYVVHSYYWVAVSPALAGLLGAGFTAPLQRWPYRGVAVATAAIALAFAATTYSFSTASWSVMYAPTWDPEGVLPIVAQIHDATSQHELVFLAGRDWTSAVFLYADRRGIMLPDFISEASLDLTGYVKFHCPGPAQPGLCVTTR